MKKCSDILRDARKAAGMSLDVAARKLNTSEPYLSMIERGTRRPVNELLILAAARLYGLNPQFVLAARSWEFSPEFMKTIELAMVDLPERIPGDGRRGDDE